MNVILKSNFCGIFQQFLRPRNGLIINSCLNCSSPSRYCRRNISSTFASSLGSGRFDQELFVKKNTYYNSYRYLYTDSGRRRSFFTMDTANLIFWACYGFGLLTFVWEFYLSWRQYLKYRDTHELPKDLAHVTDDESFKKSRAYKLDRARFGFVTDVWGQFENTIILFAGLLPIFWNISGHVIAKWGFSHEVLHSIVFITLVTIIEKFINLPWKIYDTFVIEQKHGFNKQTFGFFIKDQIKALVISLLIGLPIAAAMLWIIQKGGDYFFIFVWVFLLVITFFLMTIYPEFIAPLFDKYTPLPEGDLRTKIEALAAKLDFPLKKLFVVEGSKRSAHSNAYMYGLWNNKRIVLYDTLVANYTPLNPTKEENNKKDNEENNGENGWEKPDIAELEKESGEKKETTPVEETVKENQQGEEEKLKKQDEEEKGKKKLGMSDDEVVAVLGHELGHWKLNHTVYNIVIAELNMFLCLALFAWLYKQPALYAAFGFTKSQPILIGLFIIFGFVFAPYNEVLNFIITWWTRQMEFAADRFSAELGYATLLQSGLIKLGKDNLTFPVDDWLYSTWHYSHPPVPERIEALKKYE